MIPLATALDDVRFDALLAAARSRLPALAPEWTDYNYHDPGITLVELLAWLVETQVYSLARNRADERLAMAKLLGAPPHGAMPASGIVFPAEPPRMAQAIVADAVLLPRLASVQRIAAARAITALPHAIDRIFTVAPDGRATDQTQINARARAGFQPFGETGNGALQILLAPVEGAHAPDDAAMVLLSIGVEIEGSEPSQPVHPFGAIAASDRNGDPLVIADDTTNGLQRSGAIILDLPASTLKSPILIRPAHDYALSPRVMRVAINALPVAQRATITLPVSDGTGRPGQVIDIDPSTLFPSDEQGDGLAWRLIDAPDALTVESLDTATRWTEGALDSAGPDDRRYAHAERPDGTLISLRFGNGVNGRKPASGESLAVTLRLTGGSGGTVRLPVDWVLSDARTLWRNREPIGGGADAETVDDALAGIRQRLESDRVLATSQQIVDAALNLGSALGIARAAVEEGWERGRTKPAIAATRTLIVSHRHPGRETVNWIARIADALRPRIAIGERLLVVPPIYRPFTLAIAAGLEPGHDGARVAAAITENIADRFALSDARWPLGRNVDAATLSGWIRTIEGVGAPVTVNIGGDSTTTERLSIGRGELPYLDAPPAVTITGDAA